MPRKIPGYLHHKARNKGKVIINKRTIYLDGTYGSDESRAHYDRVIAEYLNQSTAPAETHLITIGALSLAYMEYAKGYYLKDGEQTTEVLGIQGALRPLNELYHACLAVDFGPRKLKLVRDRMISKGWLRKTVNRNVKRVVRMLSWGVSEELIPPSVHAACKELRNLQEGRCSVPEGQPVLPVSLKDVTATVEHLGRQLTGMVWMQWHSGMRPQEVRLMKMSDIDRSDPAVWEYIPERHKTEHHHKSRVIYIGPQGQEILSEFLKADPDAYIFSPLDAYNEAQERRQAAAKGKRRKPAPLAKEPKRKPRHGSSYTKDSYNRAIRRACDAAGIEPWNPNQLRHAAATRIRKEAGLDGSRTVLGHSDAQTSEIYAERDLELAKNLMREFG